MIFIAKYELVYKEQEIFLQNETLKGVHINHFSKIVSMCCIMKGTL
jgi:hypothetical protein